MALSVNVDAYTARRQALASTTPKDEANPVEKTTGETPK